jgi:hypothetical protein
METQRYETVRKKRYEPKYIKEIVCMRTFTSVFTLIGLLLCLVHYLFHDHDTIYLLFYALSVPVWFASLFPHIIYNPSLWTITLIYVLTVATWAIVGYAIDRYSEAPHRRRSRS